MTTQQHRTKSSPIQEKGKARSSFLLSTTAIFVSMFHQACITRDPDSRLKALENRSHGDETAKGRIVPNRLGDPNQRKVLVWESHIKDPTTKVEYTCAYALLATETFSLKREGGRAREIPLFQVEHKQGFRAFSFFDRPILKGIYNIGLFQDLEVGTFDSEQTEAADNYSFDPENFESKEQQALESLFNAAFYTFNKQRKNEIIGDLSITKKVDIVVVSRVLRRLLRWGKRVRDNPAWRRVLTPAASELQCDPPKQIYAFGTFYFDFPNETDRFGGQTQSTPTEFNHTWSATKFDPTTEEILFAHRFTNDHEKRQLEREKAEELLTDLLLRQIDLEIETAEIKWELEDGRVKAADKQEVLDHLDIIKIQLSQVRKYADALASTLPTYQDPETYKSYLISRALWQMDGTQVPSDEQPKKLRPTEVPVVHGEPIRQAPGPFNPTEDMELAREYLEKSVDLETIQMLEWLWKKEHPE